MSRSGAASAVLKKGGPEPLQREKLARTFQKLAQMAPTSLAAHATLFHRTGEDNKPIIPKAHHLEWIKILQAREAFRWVVIIAPPGYAKSKWISQAYVSWRIGLTGGKTRIGLIAKSGDLAANNGNGVEVAIEDPRYERVYGIRPDPKRGWSQSEMWTTGSVDPSNPNLACVGLGGYIQGRRFDEIVVDDPSDQWDVLSETTMKNQKAFIKGTLLERFPPGLGPPDGEGRMVVVCTRWGERDLVEMWRDLGFKVVTMPAIGYWDRKATCPGCEKQRNADQFSLLQRCEHCNSAEPPEFEWGREALWPEAESIEQLEAKREEDPEWFDLVYQGDPRAMSGDMFDVGMFNFRPLPDLRSFENVVQFIDTAGAKKRAKGDFFCEVTLGLREKGQEVWVLDVDRGHYAAPEQVTRTKMNYVEWAGKTGVNSVVVEEKNEGAALYQTLIIDQDIRIPLRTFMPGVNTGDKEWRARPWANVVNAGRVFIPSNQDRVPVTWARPFISEHSSFPNGRNDDQVDAAAGAYSHTTSGSPRIRVLKR